MLELFGSLGAQVPGLAIMGVIVFIFINFVTKTQNKWFELVEHTIQTNTKALNDLTDVIEKNGK
jgi:hypothetical protein